MRTPLWVCLSLAVMIVTTEGQSLQYPETRKAAQTDDYFGTAIADPYRWLEDDNSAETAAWVEAQNKVTFGYLAKIPGRDRLRARLTELWNYERYGSPSRAGQSSVTGSSAMTSTRSTIGAPVSSRIGCPSSSTTASSRTCVTSCICGTPSAA